MPEENIVVVLERLTEIKASQDAAQVVNKESAEATANEVKDLGVKIDKNDTESKDALSKVTADVEILKTDITTQLAEVKETTTYVEKAIARIGNGDGNTETSEIQLKAQREYSELLRYNKPLSEDVNDYIVTSMVEKTYFGLTVEKSAAEVKELVAGINPQGGYWIRPERLSQVVSRIFETSPLREFANIVTTASDNVEMIIDDNEFASGGWVGEVDDRDETATGDIGKLTIPIHEQFAQPTATQKMIDDAGFNIEDYVIRKIGDKMSRVENTAFVVGDGSQKPKGFLTYPAWSVAGTYERGKIEQVASGVAGSIDADSLKEMQNSLKEGYQASAIWVMKRATFEIIITLKDLNGAYIFQDRFINNRDDQRLLGKPVVFMDDMETVANDALSVAYGDFNIGYTIVDRMGIRIIRDELTKKGIVKFYANKRVGGAVTNYESLKIMKIDS